MLSTENAPPDPSCPCEISELKSISSHERVHSDHQLALKEVDLLESGLDDSNNPLPKFSIRDYVFNARGKDIQTNWPFSEKNLQLCLKHGVKDLLPPFQPLDSASNRCLGRFAVESSSICKENTNTSDVGEPSRPIACDNAPGDQKPSVGGVDTNLSGFEGDTEFPSTTTSQSQSDIDSFPTNRSSCLGSEEKIEAAAVPPAKSSRMTESTAQVPAEKCRLIVKLSNSSAATDPSSNEETLSNNFVVSEAMASKVCPVCKTFSSSSNTTLNAHIDQCLSGESTIKWTASSGVIKHRIKPRKTRLMVDIYTTARHCTLEELDRRNGTNWATNTSFAVEENGVFAEEEEQRMSPVHPDGACNRGAVYIDASGKKLRILSKFDDVPLVSKVTDDPGPRKLLKGVSKGNNTILSIKKKKQHMPRHHKFQKLTSGSKRFFSTKPRRTSEIHGCQDSNHAMEGSRLRVERAMRRFKAQEQIKLNDARTIRNWACSKRTGFTKKARDKEDQCPGDNLPQNFLTESGQSSLGDSFVVRSSVARTSNSSDADCNERVGSMAREPQVDRSTGQPPLRKRVEFLSLGSQGGSIVKSSLVLPKRDVTRLRKGSSFVSDSVKDRRGNTENQMYSPSKKRVETNAGLIKHVDSSIVSKPTGSSHASLSKAKRFSSLKSHLLSVNGASMSESVSNLKRKCTALKKSQLCGISEVDEGPVLWPPKDHQQHDSVQIDSEVQARKVETSLEKSLGRNNILKIKKRRGPLNMLGSRDAKSVMSSLSALQRAHDVEKIIDSSVLVGNADDVEAANKEGFQTHEEDNATKTVCGINFGISFMGLRKSLDPEFYERPAPRAKCGSQQFNEAYGGPVYRDKSLVRPVEPVLGDGQEFLCCGEVDHSVVAQNTHVGAELDSNNAPETYLLEVDPIPIPGPPGSFLPSPGDTGSEDLQGNSSLTSSRVQSSENHPDFDMDSSDSPISATSTISNSAVTRSDSRSSEKLPLGPHAVEGENRLDLCGASGDRLVENSTAVAKSGNIGAERINIDEMKVDTSPEKITSGYRSDQPCCCSRKEGGSQGVAFKESQILRRQTMSSVSLPASGKQMSCDSNKRPSSFNLRSGFITPTNHGSSGPGKVVLPAVRSPVGKIATTASADSEVKIAVHSDCNSSGPSSHNPVLRLMGKNLMVVNKDDDISLQPKLAPSSATSNPPISQMSTISGSSSGNFRNEDYHSIHHIMSQGPVIFGHNQCSTMGQSFDYRYLNNFRSHANCEIQTPPPIAATMFANKNEIGGFSASFEMNTVCQLNKGGCSLPIEQSSAKNRLNTSLAYFTEKVAAPRIPHYRNADATSNPVKEVIIIDDSPEMKADSATDPMLKAGLRQTQVPLGCPLASDYDPRVANVFHGYPARELPRHGVSSPGIQTASFYMPPPRPLNACPVKRNYTPENASILHSGPLVAPSSSSGHPRSTLYHSPCF